MNSTTPQNEAFKRRNLALGIRYFGDCSSQKQQKSVFEGCEVRMIFYSCKHFTLFVNSRGNVEDRRTAKGEIQIDDTITSALTKTKERNENIFDRLRPEQNGKRLYWS